MLENSQFPLVVPQNSGIPRSSSVWRIWLEFQSFFFLTSSKEVFRALFFPGWKSPFFSLHRTANHPSPLYSRRQLNLTLSPLKFLAGKPDPPLFVIITCSPRTGFVVTGSPSAPRLAMIRYQIEAVLAAALYFPSK